MMTEKDDFTRRFIRVVTADPDLDHRLGRLLVLFAVDPPEYRGQYRHHDVNVDPTGVTR